MMRKFMTGALLVTMSSASLGCSTASIIDRAINQTVDTAATRVGNQMGKALAGHVLSNLTPAMMQAYTVGLFQMLFYQGGYHFDFAEYAPGQYTHWQGKGSNHGDFFEKALLRRNEDGSEWWRVESHAQEDGEKVIVIMEALMSPPDDSGLRHIRRMRAKYPQESQPREVPITEGEADSWVVRTDRRLTQESAEGLKVGVETLQTPAGQFTTEHLRITDISQAELNWWVVQNQNVPGGIARYSQRYVDEEGNEGEYAYEMTLVKFGDEATTSKLGVF
jgi:hypothetical protein